jgi:hypothetical protein
MYLEFNGTAKPHSELLLLGAADVKELRMTAVGFRAGVTEVRLAYNNKRG